MPRWIKRNPSDRNYERSRFAELWQDLLDDQKAEQALNDQPDADTSPPSMP